jgi:hypothetical protein
MPVTEALKFKMDPELGLETLKSERERQDMALAHKYVMSERQGLFDSR